MSVTPFTPAQLDAVDVDLRHQDACVVAGPGSGKTTVLVEYFRRLVGAGVDPLRILAITFTEKAAGNMRKKLADAFQDDHAIRAALERAWVSTVHGFCARLLRENAVFAGVDPEFYVSDERESWRAQQEAIAAALESLFAEHPAAVRALIRGLSSIEFEEAVLSGDGAMRDARRRRTSMSVLRRVDQLYRQRKRQAGALDFSDLEEFTVRLLEEHPETRERLRAQFDHILMDEFQDTNGQQAKLLRLIRPPDRF